VAHALLQPDAAEFITKVSFAETRAYVERVLGARERYRDLYGAK
jgi:soluble lytic murein transglycosylase-like protein